MTRVGDRIDERYELEAHAGAGGMGLVFRAREIDSDRLVALKILRQDRGDQQRRFEREAALLAELQHDAIAEYRGQGTLQDGSRYLAMEWIEGPTLTERLRRKPMEPPEALRLASRMAAALGAAHAAGIVHRDMKPANILLPGGEAERAKLVDFGVARQAGLDTTTLTETGAAVGTLRYMAPEQARDAKQVDARRACGPGCPRLHRRSTT
ncbi:MAG: serine/threonine protein kinase [Deltaproteobacteria bacterium]|nr:serine/threonine protein kinase [Deltaproteobacteria bacterium]